MRKTPFIRFVSLTMAVLLVITSTGFIVVEHNCLMRGKSKSVWMDGDSCKPGCDAPAKPSGHCDKETTHLSKQPCCEETLLLSRADITSTIHSVDSQESLLPMANPVPHQVYAPVCVRSVISTFHLQRPDPGPLVHSASRYIALLCVWLL